MKNIYYPYPIVTTIIVITYIENSFTTIPRYNDLIQPVPWYSIIIIEVLL